MKRSKHFRKDVIIARLIFCVACAIILALVTFGINTLLEKIKDSETEDSETKDFVSESIMLDTELNVEIETQSESESESETQLESESELESEIGPKPNDLYILASDNVKLRKQPSMESEEIITIAGGTSVLFLEEQEGWYKVRYQEQEGFISADFSQKQFTEDDLQKLREWEARQLELSMKTWIAIDPMGEQLVFDIVGLLKQELQRRDYVVKLTRTIEETNVTAQQRAEIATTLDADITIGIYMENSEDVSMSGARAFAPSSANTSMSELAPNCQRLSQEIMNAYCSQTGMKHDGIIIDDTKEEINYASMPITMISLGYITNPSDSSNMQDNQYQKKMVKAIADGIDAYFAQQ